MWEKFRQCPLAFCLQKLNIIKFVKNVPSVKNILYLTKYFLLIKLLNLSYKHFFDRLCNKNKKFAIYALV